jgi:hypothetical protein
VRNFQSSPKHGQSQGEEIANSISHGIGLVGALIGTPFLIIHALRQGDAGFIVGTRIFSMSMILLYLASTLCYCRHHMPLFLSPLVCGLTINLDERAHLESRQPVFSVEPIVEFCMCDNSGY